MHKVMITRILAGVFCVPATAFPLGPTLADENHGYEKDKSTQGGMMKEHYLPGY